MCDDTHGMTLYRENKLLNTGVQAHNGHFFASGHCLTSSVCEESITLFFFTLRECNKKDSEPKEPVVGMIDGALEAAQALVNVWPNIRVELCVWHVSRAWSRALQKKKWEDRTKMTDVLKDAESIMYKMDISERDTSLEEFRRRWASEQDVLAYFEAEYFHRSRLPLWCLRLEVVRATMHVVFSAKSTASMRHCSVFS
mmetsp:Transcript_8180/g.13232  ORF Transcript_8180/g.13232 Transcript_8180/m.13232 type:complete len:198 (+) Transcript_8180:387-980(+)